MQLSAKDLSWFRLINGFGFMTCALLSQLSHRHRRTISERLATLTTEGYLQAHRLPVSAATIYTVTKQGAAAAGDALPALKQIRQDHFQHDWTLMKVATALLQHYGGQYIPERRIRQFHGYSLDEASHVSDGLLALPDKTIAIEVELSSKSRQRRQSIVSYYTKAYQYDEVWYICRNQMIQRQIAGLIERRPFIKLMDCEQILSLECLHHELDFESSFA